MFKVDRAQSLPQRSRVLALWKARQVTQSRRPEHCRSHLQHFKALAKCLRNEGVQAVVGDDLIAKWSRLPILAGKMMTREAIAAVANFVIYNSLHCMFITETQKGRTYSLQDARQLERDLFCQKHATHDNILRAHCAQHMALSDHTQTE